MARCAGIPIGCQAPDNVVLNIQTVPLNPPFKVVSDSRSLILREIIPSGAREVGPRLVFSRPNSLIARHVIKAVNEGESWIDPMQRAGQVRCKEGGNVEADSFVAEEADRRRKSIRHHIQPLGGQLGPVILIGEIRFDLRRFITLDAIHQRQKSHGPH